MAADTSTLYAQLSTIQFSDFTPSRITRPSSNHLLQEHGPVANLCSASVARGNRERSHSAMVCSNIPLKGRYVDVDIAESYPGGIPIVNRVRIAEEEPITGRGHSLSDPTAGCTINPLCIRSRNESKRTAIRRKQTEKKMDAPSFIVLESCNENKCNGTEIASSRKRIPDAKPLGIPAVNKIRIKKRHFSPPRSPPPPPPPPPPIVESGFPREDKSRREVEHGVPEVTSVVDEAGYVTVHRLDTSDYTDSARIGDEKSRNEDESSISLGNARSAYSSGNSSPTPCSYIVRTENGRIAITEDDSQHSSDAEDPVPSVFQRAHKPLTRHSPSSPLSRSAPSSRVPPTMPPIPSPLLQDGSSLPQIGRTKPVPPPRRKTILQETNVRHQSESRVLKSTKSSPDLHAPAQRARSVSFLQCKVGEDCGQYPADYLGCKEVDCYIECVDHVAKQLVDSRPVEVVAYVTSEKVRLAPPKNAALLFKSFAMKDILSVQKCSKNKRIIGIVVWKPKSLPACHVLRCPNHLVANSLYEATWYQSQSVDDVALKSKVNPPIAPEGQPRPPSEVSTSSSEGSHTLSPFPFPISPTELLHKFPAKHIGSTVAGKLHSVNEVVQKVLAENKPSQAKEVCMWLSLAQVRLVDMSDDSEMIYAAHETSRIRAIGVYAPDKRFIGYIIKEEGKPLMGHVLRCNSAGLMVSLVSFLRQSCQITFYQRGGSFYDELSTDDSEDCDNYESPGGCESPGIIKRLRSLTMSQHTATSPTSNSATFVSHTRQHTLATDTPPSKRDSIQTSTVFSPLDFTEDDYARFSVNYVGSAILDLPLTHDSILDALKVFEEHGMAAGQAAVPKNVIHMQVSSLGINLTDKKHRLFVSRNYPRKQLEGFSLHPEDPKCFAFASRRPGFPSSIKCHVFKQVHEPTVQIMDAIKFWLDMVPVADL